MPMTDDRVLHAILEVLSATDPLRLRKAQLLTMRQRAIEIAVAGIEGRKPPEPMLGAQDEDYLLACSLVLGYEGQNSFIRSLRQALEVYGSLTERQAQAVLAPPHSGQMEQMARYGVEGVSYRWQAEDAIREAQREARSAAARQAAERRKGRGDG